MVEETGEVFYVVTRAGGARKYKTLSTALRAVVKSKGEVKVEEVTGNERRVILWCEAA